MRLTNQDAFLKSEALVSSILEKMAGLNKARKKFILHLFLLFLGLRGRYNFLNMARYGSYSEQSYRNHFQKDFDFAQFNGELIEQFCSSHLIIAFDPSYVPKSGKKTDHLGKFWSGCSGKALKGLEMGGFAVVDIQKATAMSLESIQTPSAQQLACEGKSLVDHYAELVIERKDTLIKYSDYLVADSYFAKQKFILPVLENTELHIVSKLRNDADLRYLYEGAQGKGRGRPKKYNGKVDVKNIGKDRFTLCLEEDGIRVYTAILYSMTLKKKIRVAYVQHFQNGEPSGRYAILFTTDLELAGELILLYYKSRFQIEFLFRDAKQHAGLNHCQARSKEKLNFHFNAALTTVSIAKAIFFLDLNEHQGTTFSMRNVKTWFLNRLMVERFLSNFEIDPNTAKNNPIYLKLLSWGRIAA